MPMKINPKLLFLAPVILLAALVFGKNSHLLFNETLAGYAEEILVKCSKEEFTPNCYDREIPKLMKYISMEDAFEVTKLVQEKDRKYLFCHVLAHELADIETKKDPDRWMDVAARCPVTMCNNGCPHGAIIQKFQSDVLSDAQVTAALPDLENVCEPRGKWNPTEVERSMCYHSIGHINMYITGANIDKSIALCKQIAIKEDERNYYQTCVQGVFMIIYQGIEPDDFALVKDIKPTKERVPEFCRKYTGIEYIACRTEAWPFFADEIRKPEGLVKFCSFTNDWYGQKWCYGTGLSSLSLELLEVVENAGIEKVNDFCLALPLNHRAECFAFSAARWVQVDPSYAPQSVSLCEMAEAAGLGENCFHDLLYYSKYSFHFGSPENKAYCNNFKEPYKDRCLSGKVPDNFYFNK
jgi:hypothetical protein